jgi:hypothetical protein
MWPYPAVFNVLDPWWNSGSGYKPLTPNDTYIAPGENAEIVWAGVGLLNPTFLAIGK